MMQVNWTTGQLKMERNLTKYSPRFLNGRTDFENDRVPYPFRLAASKDNLAVISMVCCETWQVTKIHRFTSIIYQCHMTLFPGTIAGPPPFLAPLGRTDQDGEAARRRKNGASTFHMLNQRSARNLDPGNSRRESASFFLARPREMIF